VQTTPLDPQDLDLLKEVSNIGAGNAATALARMLGEVITLTIPEVRVLELGAVADALGGPERVVVAIHLGVIGEARGNLLLTLSPAAATQLLSRLGFPDASPESLPPLATSALREIGNILGGTYLTALSRLLHRHLVPTVPGLAVDMAGAVVDLLLTELAGVSAQALVLETTFAEARGGGVSGSIFFLPHPDGLEALVAGGRRRP
jgi:chemotaxis protein CheC